MYFKIHLTLPPIYIYIPPLQTPAKRETRKTRFFRPILVKNR